jgi:hypothetical protein
MLTTLSLSFSTGILGRNNLKSQHGKVLSNAQTGKLGPGTRIAHKPGVETCEQFHENGVSPQIEVCSTSDGSKVAA